MPRRGASADGAASARVHGRSEDRRLMADNDTWKWVVSFSRHASDGNYGSETIRIERTLVAELGHFPDASDAASAIAECRALAHAELAKSPSWRVRDAIDAHEVTAVTVPSDDPEELPY